MSINLKSDSFRVSFRIVFLRQFVPECVLFQFFVVLRIIESIFHSVFLLKTSGTLKFCINWVTLLWRRAFEMWIFVGAWSGFFKNLQWTNNFEFFWVFVSKMFFDIPLSKRKINTEPQFLVLGLLSGRFQAILPYKIDNFRRRNNLGMQRIKFVLKFCKIFNIDRFLLLPINF